MKSDPVQYKFHYYKWIVSSLVIIFLSILFLSSCGQYETSSTISDTNTLKFSHRSAGKDTIKMIGHWKDEGGRQIFLEQIVKEFNFLNQDLHVEIYYPEDMPEIQSLIDLSERHSGRMRYIAGMIRSNRIEYDIVPMMGSIYRRVGVQLEDPAWGKRHLVDFLKVSGYIEAQKPTVFKNLIHCNNTMGNYVGPFIEGSYHTLHYNSSLAKKMNLDIKQFDMTMDDMVRYVDQIQQYNKDHGTQIVPLYESSDWLTILICFEQLFKSEIEFSGSQSIPRSFSARNQRAFLKTLRAIQTLYQKGAFGRYPEDAVPWGEATGYPLNDRCIFYINGSWMYNIWEDIDSEKVINMRPAELPVFKACDYYLGLYVMDFAVLKNSPNSDKAIEFLMFMSSKDASSDWTRYAKSPSGVIGHLESAGLGGDAYERFNNALDRKYGERIIQHDNNYEYVFGNKQSEVTNAFTDGIRSIISGTKSANQVYEEILAYFQTENEVEPEI
ncbi:carbohydrate ABC transporter substrate-binding protein [candidate division KSB1 bacterium]|nr:carbohydrate ABC transporter substrate-binding protein [candidate division KSB1 bacterium]